MSKPKVDIGDELVADNRKAGHDFHFLEQFEAGLVLLGTEVKAARRAGGAANRAPR